MALTIGEVEREVLCEELEVFAESVRDTEARTRYTALRQAVGAGQVDEPLIEPLEQVLEIVLHTGRVRRIHGPQTEQALLRLFHQTGRGSTICAATQAANRSLAALKGQVIHEMAFTARTPGDYRLVIDTDRCRLTLEIDREGVWLENAAVGL
ncbi:MAG: hypothetical protein ACE5LU_01605 [Anaerolineae bacterium]